MIRIFCDNPKCGIELRQGMDNYPRSLHFQFSTDTPNVFCKDCYLLAMQAVGLNYILH